MDFPITPDVGDVQTFTVGSIVAAVMMILIFWALTVATNRDLFGPIMFTAFVAVGTPLLVVSYARARFGSLTVDSSGLLLRKGRVQERFGWANIKSLKEADPHVTALPLVRLLIGSSVSSRCVELELRRSLKMGISLFRGGTELAGVPFGVKTLRLYTPAPEAVVNAARPHLQTT